MAATVSRLLLDILDNSNVVASDYQFKYLISFSQAQWRGENMMQLFY